MAHIVDGDCPRTKQHWNESHLRHYDIKTEPIPRMSSKDAESRIAAALPVIVTDVNVVGPAVAKWKLDYLRDNMGDIKFTVYQSNDHKFKYFDEKKIAGCKDFKPPMQHVNMSFDEFLKKVRNWKEGDKRLYLQTPLTEGVGSEIVSDFVQFRWDWVTAMQKKMGWGGLTSNLLLIGMPGNVTPCHFDEQENFFCQVEGYKRVILFPPSQFPCLYTHPIYHPHDRQSQVDFENPDYERFPRFREAKGLEAVLGPTEVLYLPTYWFHHFESLLEGGTTTSITFWYKSAPVKDIVYPLKDHQKVSMMRNIEKMITEALNNPAEVPPFMQAMALGRYT